MVSTSIIRLAASAAILAGVNGQGITLTHTAFETVHISRFSSVTVTVDQPITTIPSTTSVGMIPVIITTTMTIMVPVRETISILPTFTSPDSNAIITPVPTVPIHTLAVHLFRAFDRYPKQHYERQLILHPHRYAHILSHPRSHAGHEDILQHNNWLQQSSCHTFEPSRYLLKPFSEYSSAAFL
ncbi:hypothetical protein LY78DRAFT_649494 [Colletotrichum sublineola]|nr:hypothetical protein LY78DRAFT_649494 [Colletotrichum sublineola]